MKKNDILGQYFQQNGERSGLCHYNPVVEVTPVRQGEHCQITEHGYKRSETAVEDGFIVHIEKDRIFYDAKSFRQRFARIDEWLRGVVTDTLPPATMATPVLKGEPIRVHVSERSQQATSILAPSDGWIVNSHEEGKCRFMPEIVYRSQFRTEMSLPDSLKNIYRFRSTTHDMPPLPYVRMGRDIHYRDDMNIPHIAYAGHFLLALPGVPREYGVVEPENFFRNFTLIPAPPSQERKIIPFRKRTP